MARLFFLILALLAPSFAFGQEVRGEFATGADFHLYGGGVIVPWLSVGGGVRVLSPDGSGLRLDVEVQNPMIEARPGLKARAGPMIGITPKAGVEAAVAAMVLPGLTAGKETITLLGGGVGVTLPQESGTLAVRGEVLTMLGSPGIVWTFGLRLSVP